MSYEMMFYPEISIQNELKKLVSVLAEAEWVETQYKIDFWSFRYRWPVPIRRTIISWKRSEKGILVLWLKKNLITKVWIIFLL